MAPAPSRPATPPPITAIRARSSQSPHARSLEIHTPSSPSQIANEEPAEQRRQPAPTPEEILQRTRERIECLERIEAMHEKEAALWQKIGGSTENPKKRPREDGDEDDGRHKSVKVTNVIRFNTSMTFRRRQEWLEDLETAFIGDPRRYKSLSNRIVFALENMDSAVRSRWHGHCRAQEPERRLEMWSDWQHFEDWTSTLVNDMGDEDMSALKDLEKATHRIEQSPWDFNTYLETLEARFPRLSDKERANRFFVKLHKDLRDHLELYFSSQRPSTREETVQWATRIWKTDKFQREVVSPAKSRRFNPETRSNPSYGTHGYRGRNPRVPRGRATQQITCYKCGGLGHYASNCPNSKQEQSRGGFRGRGQGRGRNPRNSAPNRQGNGQPQH